MYYTQGRSYEKVAKSWNGSGPKTIDYWKKVKSKLLYLRITINEQLTK